MLCFFVPPQIHFALKAFATKIASERLESCVFSAVCDEVWTLTEGFATHLTLVGLFTCKMFMKNSFFFFSLRRTVTHMDKPFITAQTIFGRKMCAHYFHQNINHLYEWTCVFSYPISGGIVCRSTDRDTVWCQSGWGGAWTKWTTSWSFCRIFCSWRPFPAGKKNMSLVRSEVYSGWSITYCDNASIGPTCECTALCCSRLTAWPNVFPQISHAKGLVPLCDRRTWTSSPWGVENTYLRTKACLEEET